MNDAMPSTATLTHLERLTAHDAVVCTRMMMTVPPYGSPEELAEAMATLTGLYEVMVEDATRTRNGPFLKELAVWMEPERRREAVEQARQHIETLPKQPERSCFAATPKAGDF